MSTVGAVVGQCGLGLAKTLVKRASSRSPSELASCPGAGHMLVAKRRPTLVPAKAQLAAAGDPLSRSTQTIRSEQTQVLSEGRAVQFVSSESVPSHPLAPSKVQPPWPGSLVGALLFASIANCAWQMWRMYLITQKRGAMQLRLRVEGYPERILPGPLRAGALVCLGEKMAGEEGIVRNADTKAPSTLFSREMLESGVYVFEKSGVPLGARSADGAMLARAEMYRKSNLRQLESAEALQKARQERKIWSIW